MVWDEALPGSYSAKRHSVRSHPNLAETIVLSITAKWQLLHASPSPPKPPPIPPGTCAHLSPCQQPPRHGMPGQILLDVC